jgi:hypothetical protein
MSTSPAKDATEGDGEGEGDTVGEGESADASWLDEPPQAARTVTAPMAATQRASTGTSSAGGLAFLLLRAGARRVFA